MCCATVGKLTQVLSGEEGLCQLLGSNPGKGRLSESQLLLVVQHRVSLEAREEVDCGLVHPDL